MEQNNLSQLASTSPNPGPDFPLSFHSPCFVSRCFSSCFESREVGRVTSFSVLDQIELREMPKMANSFPEEVLEHVFSFIQTDQDRNSISTVCKSWYEIERWCRRRIFIGNCYAVSPRMVIRRFPDIRSIELKGKPHFADFNLVPDGKLRYLGGETRVLAVPRSISFSELSSKLTELCGPSVTAVSLRCQLPTEDLDALVSIKSDEDLVNLIEEYDRAASSANMKIRAFLSLIPTARTPRSISSPSTSSASAASTTSSSGNSSSSNNYFSAASGSTPRFPMPSSTPVDRCLRQMPPQPSPSTVPFQRPPSKVPHCANIYHARQGHGSNRPASTTGSRPYLVHNGNHWQ